MPKITETRLWIMGDKVTYTAGKVKYVGVVDADQTNARAATLVTLPNGVQTWAWPEDLKAYEPTIHEQAREQFELAMTYAEDGAFGSAYRILAGIALEYKNRAASAFADMAVATGLEAPKGMPGYDEVVTARLKAETPGMGEEQFKAMSGKGTIEGAFIGLHDVPLDSGYRGNKSQPGLTVKEAKERGINPGYADDYGED
jgi:hypothetical protein